MSPTPVTFSSPTAPASYAWEATDEGVAQRYGLALEDVIRFDLNTSPAPPDLVAEILAAGRFETSLSEYPPGDYRRLVEAAAGVYGVDTAEIVPGAGADEILDMIVKAFLSAGQAAVVPVPSYAMYRVVTEQRGGRVIPVPRQGPQAGWAIDADGVRAAAREASLVWLCSPNNPTGLPEPRSAIEGLLEGIVADADAAGRPLPALVVDEAYAEFSEFSEGSSIDLRSTHPNLVVVRTLSKAYALAGLRVGFAIARPDTIDRVATYRPPGSISTVSVTIGIAALQAPEAMRGNVARVTTERPRLAAALAELGWRPQPSATNFFLLDFERPARAATVAEALMRRGLVPRTFGAGHPLAHALRITVRAPEENDRLIAAAREIQADLDAGRLTDQPEEPR